jgi:hypothetical protein
MDIRLSWDLFVVVFFVIIVAYSLIIGRDNTLKVILGTYVAALAADACGNLFGLYFSGSELFLKILKLAAVGSEQEAVVFVKVLVFVVLVILFAVRGAFEVQTVDDKSAAIRMVLSGLYAVMSACLIISAILVFVSGVSFIGGGSPETTGSALWGIYNKSQLIRLIVNNSYILFAVPALSFLVHSLYSTKKE